GGNAGGQEGGGWATRTASHLHRQKRAGTPAGRPPPGRERPPPGGPAITHARGATHGPATDANAHPHVGGNHLVAVVHNGVIENYTTLKRQLQSEGVTFHSDTDTEVIAQLIALHLNGDLVEAVAKVLNLLKGTYGLAVVSPRNPDLVVGARLGSPLVLGIGQGENYLASDPSALLGLTEKVVYLQDNQMCMLAPDSWQILDRQCTRVEASVHRIDWEVGDADRGVFDHYMLKEIYEQPETL